MDPCDLAWLAGILEGEGSFSMSRNRQAGKVYRYPKIVVTMTDRDVVERVAALFGTSVYDIPATSTLPGRKMQYRATITGSRAARLMSSIRSQMGARRRRRRIDEALDEYGELEPTEVRRQKACSNSAKLRWAAYGTRSGKL